MIVRGGRPGLLDTMARTGQQAAPASAGGVDVAGEIRKLADLKAAGALTDEEFAAAKSKLLA
jgi:hypothetical protein